MPRKQRKVLVIDDGQTNLVLLKAHLTSMGLVPILADNAADGLKFASEQLPDIILLDVMMPEMDGHEVCRKLKADVRTSPIPIIFVSAKDQSEDKIFGLKLGAIDYVTKPFNKGELVARIGIVLQMIELQERLLMVANIDELTGLANRRHIFEILEYQMQEAIRCGGSLAIMMFDIDHFKNINDTYGHLNGDRILQQLSKILTENIYSLDTAARYGGEEFVVLMPGVSADIAVQRAEKLRVIIDKHNWEISNQPISVTCSVGISVFDGSGNGDFYELIRKADDALYAAKHHGRNCVVSYNQISPEERTVCSNSGDFRELQSKISALAMQIRTQTLGTIEAFVNAIAVKDPYLVSHAENMKIYAVQIAKQMRVSQSLVEQLQTAAMLCDLGKIAVPNEILNKPSHLTDDERKIVERHPIAGAEILAPIGLFSQEIVIIRHHHENFDGTGYPNGLVGKNIPVGSRILAVADSFDAMTSTHANTIAKTADEALNEIISLSGQQYDPEVVEAFRIVFAENHDNWPLAQKQKEVKI